MAPWVKALQGERENLSLQPRSLHVGLEYLECQPASKTQNANTKEKIWAFSPAELSLGYLLPLVPVSPGCGRLRQLFPCPESGAPTTGCPWWPLGMELDSRRSGRG